jgi:hypothetical protein
MNVYSFITNGSTGDGSTVTFTADVEISSSVVLVCNGLIQNPGTFTVSGETVTFNDAPPVGTILWFYQ